MTVSLFSFQALYLLFLFSAFLKNEWKWNFIKCFLYINGDHHIISLLYSVNVVNFIHWLLHIKLALYSLKTLNGLYISLDWQIDILLRSFAYLLVDEIVIFFSGFGIKIILACQNGLGSILSSILQKSFCKISAISYMFVSIQWGSYLGLQFFLWNGF